MRHRIHLHILLLLAILFAGLSIEAADAGDGDLFWKNRISTAIAVRNEAFGALVPESAGNIITAWPQPLRNEALRRIASDGGANTNPWFLLIKGILSNPAESESSPSCFTAALDAAAVEPGTTWLLFVEFDRYRLHPLTDTALSRLEKQMFTSGGRASVIISNQLTHLGQIKKINRESNTAQRYFIWAHRFNPSETMSILYRMHLASMLHPVVMVKTIAELFPVINSSWKAQLEFLGFWYELIRRALFLFIILTVALFAVKYLPAALHQSAHRYPDKLPPPLRTLLVSAVIITLSAFGIIPFIWFLAIFLWRLVVRSERLLLGSAVALLALAPLDAAVMERLDYLRNPEGTMMRLSRALDEGRDPYATRSETSSLHHDEHTTASASLIRVLDEMKNGDREGALRRIAPVIAEHPDDPVAANIRGIIHMLNGSIDSAAVCFNRILSSYPRDVAATFNLSRCSVALNDATVGMDLLKNAARLAPATVNNFIEGNDRYFSGNWPQLRSVMFPDYSPLQFWKWFFIPSFAAAPAWRDYWGVSFLGIPPGVSLVLFILALLGTAAYLQLGLRRPKPRRLFECKYCGRITCRKCSAGVICAPCAEKTLELKGSKSFSETIEQIASTTLHTTGLRTALLNFFVPGSGLLFKTRPAIPTVTAGILAASVVYAYWHTLLGGVRFSWMTSAELLCTLSIPLLFHLSCAILYLPAACRHLLALLRADSLKERSSDGT